MVLNEGDTVLTGASSVIFLQSSNGHTIHLAPNSSLYLRSSGEENGARYNVIDLMYGIARSIVQDFGNEKKKFELRHKSVSLGVRGTDFLTIATGEGLDVLLNEGKLLIQNKVALLGGNRAQVSSAGEITSSSSMTRLEFARAIQLAAFGSDEEHSDNTKSGSGGSKQDSSSADDLIRSGDTHALAKLGLSSSELNDLGALPMAAENGQLKMIKLLIDSGADVNLQDGSGKTALMYAIERKQRASVEALLEAGASKSIKDGSGKSAYDYARLSENRDIQNLISR